MTLEEFKALKPLEGRRVHIEFTDGLEVIARLIDITTDMDESRHVVYDRVEWSSGFHAPNSNGAFYAPGDEVRQIALA